MPWQVDHPDAITVYEGVIGHTIREDTPMGAGEFFVHPDDCDACLDRVTHEMVRAQEQRIQEAVEAIRPFFAADIPYQLLLNIGLSFHLTMIREPLVV